MSGKDTPDPTNDSNSELNAENSSVAETGELKESRAKIAELEKQLSLQADVYNSMLSSISDFAHTSDKEGRFVFVNQALLDLWGLTLEQVVGKNFYDLNYPEDLAAKLHGDIQEVIDTGKKVSGKTPYVTRIGKLSHYEYTYSPLFAPDGTVEMVVCASRDITFHKETEAEIKYLNQRNRDILESISEAFFTVGEDWKFTYANHGTELLLDRAAESLIGKNMWEEYPGVVGSDFEAVYRNAMENRVEGRITQYYPDHKRWYELNAFPSANGVTVYFRNVTEQKKSEERYRVLFDSMDQGFCLLEIIFDDNMKGIDYRFLELNPAFEKVTGLSVNEARQGKTARELVPDLEEKWAKIYGEVALTGNPVKFSEGSEAMGRWFEVDAFRAGDPGEHKVALIFNNITDRKQAEIERDESLRQLEAERARLAYIFEKAPAFVTVLRGAEHVYEIANPAYQQLIGHRDVIGKTVREALPDLVGQGYYELLDSVYQNGEPFIGNESAVEFQSAPNSPFEKKLVDFVFQPIFEADKTVSGIFVHGVDISQQVEARQQAETANRLKDEFLATLSHELRTPLNAILGWSQILQNRPLEEDELQKALAIIERSARSQNQLIEDILDVSRIITGKLRLDVRAVDLLKVITAAIDSATPAADAKGIRLQTLLDPKATAISGDPDRLQQVVWNLLSNAVKFTPKGGRVQIRLERINSHVEIVVSDTGRGIEAEFLPHVFERFRQSDGSMTRRQGGLGLGLAIVRQIVELHGGTVAVESDGEGHGAKFTIHLPLLPVRTELAEASRIHPEAESGEPIIEIAADLSRLKILVVDDETDSRDLLKFVLHSKGANVTTGRSAAEAFEIAKREKFDIIISDIGMPEEDGFSLIKKIRTLPSEQNGKTPAIALTAYARAEDRIQAIQSGFQIHIAKPVNHTELIAVAANLAGRFTN